MPGIRFNRAFEIIRGAKAFINLECGLTRGAVPNPRQQVRDQAQNLREYKHRLAQQRQRLLQKDREIARLKKHSGANTHTEEARARKSGSRPARNSGTLPDYLIIGAQKGGTTYLYHLLCEHPYVAPAAKKEIHYFDSRRFEKGSEWYRSQFPVPEEAGDGQEFVIGEASPYYLYHPRAARRAAQLLPEVKLIALLRNPVDRAYSDYRHKLNGGSETLSFEEAIEAEERRTAGEREKMLADASYNSFELRRFTYLDRGVYVYQLREWLRFFSEEQLLVLKSEDLFEHPASTVNVVLGFLGLPARSAENFEQSTNSRSYEPINPKTRERLQKYFEPHNQKLYDYLGRDFGW